MSESLLVFDTWPAGITQASIPVNNNARRAEVLAATVISAATTAQPATPAERDLYIIPTGKTGTAWATFAVGDLAYYRDATWTAFAPFDGLIKSMAAGGAMQYDAAAWGAFGGGGTFTGGALTSALNEAKGADIASAATTNIGAATGNLVHVTGTTTITALGTVQAGTRRVVVFDGILILTHHATSLILPTGANITTAAGDVGIFVSEGAGNWRAVVYQRKDGSALLGGGGGGLTNFTEAVNTSAPNATIPVASFIPLNAATHVDFALIPKGASGALLGQIPDSGIGGGNKRGTQATDWQRTRAAANQAAEGNYATIGGGENNRAAGTDATIPGGNGNIANGTGSFASGTTSYATGANSVAIGVNNVANNSASVALGNGNTSSSTSTVALGISNTASASAASAIGTTNTASGASSSAIGDSNSALSPYGRACGYRSSTYAVIGASALASGIFAAIGDAERLEYVMRSDTANATPEKITTNNDTAGTTNQVILENNSAMIVRGDVIARQNSTGDTKSWEFRATVKRGANAAATSIVGTAVVTIADADAGAAAWTLALAADTTNGGLSATVTGEAAKNLRWVTNIRSVLAVG